MIVIYYVAGVITIGAEDPSFRIAPVILLIFICLRIALHLGHENVVSLMVLGVSWVVVSYVFIFLQNGLRAPAYTASLAFLIIYAGLLHGQLAATIVVGVNLLTTIALIALEENGIYFSEPAIPNILWVGFGQLVIFPAIALMLSRALESLQQSEDLLSKESASRQKLEEEISQLTTKLATAYETTFEGWSRTLELKNMEIYGHSKRVTELALRLADEFGIEGDELLQIKYGALLHDIGEIGIPDEILHKPGPLNPEERKVMERHPLVAHELLKGISFLKKACDIAYYHHERWDGQGYPLGKKGEDIPFAARLFSVVDVWDALTSGRPYSESWSPKEAKQYLREQSGIQFDPRVVDKFLNLMD
jgi:putative nucleotidyltransferase with HDIG domain